MDHGEFLFFRRKAVCHSSCLRVPAAVNTAVENILCTFIAFDSLGLPPPPLPPFLPLPGNVQICMFNNTQIFMLAMPLGYLTLDSPRASYVIRALSVLLTDCGTLGLIFIPKVRTHALDPGYPVPTRLHLHFQGLFTCMC